MIGDKGDSVETRFQLANAWQFKGNLEAAIEGYLHVLRLQPDYAPAYIQLGKVMLKQGAAEEALEYYEGAFALAPDDESIDLAHKHVRDMVAHATTRPSPDKTSQVTAAFHLEDNPDGMIDMREQMIFNCHRSGWNFALNALKPLHNSGGIQFDGFIERNFAWRQWQEGVRSTEVLEKMKRARTFNRLATTEEKGITPYTRPWVGFVHNPQDMPAWLHYQQSPQSVFAKHIWKQSLPYCAGLFTLSEHAAKWLREQTGKTVSSLVYPTEVPELQFDFKKFESNPRKKIVQIGWWLRRLNAIYELPVARGNPLKYEKIRLVPIFFDHANEYLRGLMRKEIEVHSLNIDPAFSSNTTEILHLPDEQYDELLSENVAFVDLYDAGASSTIVECIARATPLLINPLPAVVEYLGSDYPMYFSSLREAADKALNLDLINDTHIYLVNCETRTKLSAEHFLRTFRESEVYQLIR
jgi:tetratricopeptide (TPR) repeat protein